MISNAELLSLLCTTLSKLDVGEFAIKVGLLAFSYPSFVPFSTAMGSTIEKFSMVYSKYVVSQPIKKNPYYFFGRRQT